MLEPTTQQQNFDLPKAGANGTRSGDKFATELAENVASAAGPNADPRMATVISSLVRHLHAFAREVDLTHDEWMAGVEFLNEMGRLSPVRNETQILCDILGIETLVDHLSSGQDTARTPSAVLGPFYKDSRPVRAMGESIASAKTNASHATETTRIQGQVLSSKTGAPIAGALVDIWHADPDGVYDGQGTANTVLEPNDLRGVFETGPDGKYDICCLRPGSYPLPDDGPVGHLLGLLDRPRWRPAHLHFKVSAPGYRPLTTQLFDSDDKHLKSDVVFAVKHGLMIKFCPVDHDPKAH